MSGRAWKDARRAVKPFAKNRDRAERAAARPPLWRRILGFVFPRVLKTWRDRFEKKHDAALRRATKKTAHATRGKE